MQSQALNHLTEKKPRFSKFLLLLRDTPDHWLGYCLNPEWVNTRAAAIPSLDYYQALTKSVCLPGSQFPGADAGTKGTHRCPPKVLCAQPQSFRSPLKEQGTWLWPYREPSTRRGLTLPRSVVCSVLSRPRWKPAGGQLKRQPEEGTYV